MNQNLFLKNDLSEIERLTEAVFKFGKGNNLSKETIGDLRLALEEIVANIISHGYENNSVHQITVDIRYTDEEITIEVKDNAKPFNPLSISGPEIENPYDGRKVSGIGIYIVCSLMDQYLDTIQ
jgi:serine/threonine-protein kinase RsbW